MKLRVTISSSFGGLTNYDIIPDEAEGKIGLKLSDETTKRFRSLRPRIEAMACRQLGKQFHSLNVLSQDSLELRVRSGTSKGEKRFEMRSLIGWIELFDSEERRPRRKK